MSVKAQFRMFAYEPLFDENNKMIHGLNIIKNSIKSNTEQSIEDPKNGLMVNEIAPGSIKNGGIAAVILLKTEPKDGGALDLFELKDAKLSRSGLTIYDNNEYLSDINSSDIPERIAEHLLRYNEVSTAFVASEMIAERIQERIIDPYINTLSETDTACLLDRLEKLYQFVSKKLLSHGTIKTTRGGFAKGSRTSKFIKFIDDSISKFIEQFHQEQKKGMIYGKLKRDATDKPLEKYRNNKVEIKEGVYILCGSGDVALTEDENALCFAMSALISAHYLAKTLEKNELLYIEAINKENDQRKRKKLIKEYEKIEIANSNILNNVAIEQNDDCVIVEASISVLLDTLFGMKTTRTTVEWFDQLIINFGKKQCLRYAKINGKLRKVIRNIILDFTTEIEDNTQTVDYSLETAKLKNLRQFQDTDDRTIENLFERQYTERLTVGKAKEIKYKIGITKDILVLPSEDGKKGNSYNALPWDTLKCIYANSRYIKTASKVFGWARIITMRIRNTEKTQIAIDTKQLGYNHRTEYKLFTLLQNALQKDGIILDTETTNGKTFFIVTNPKRIENKK